MSSRCEKTGYGRSNRQAAMNDRETRKGSAGRFHKQPDRGALYGDYPHALTTIA